MENIMNYTFMCPFIVPPKWIREPQDVHAILGRDVVLNCEVEGYPRPTTLWTRANGKLPTMHGWPSLEGRPVSFIVCLKVQSMT